MDINVVGFGPNTGIETQVDVSHYAARVSPRPFDHVPALGGVAGGHYAISTQTGLIAAGIASAAQVFQIRWADPTKLFIPYRLTAQFATATGFAATSLGAPVELIIGHGSTANGSGGTALAPTSISNKMRSSMASTAFATSGEIRIASTAALTAATGQTLEPAPIASCAGAPNAAISQSVPYDLIRLSDLGNHPLVLNAGDTLAIRTNSPAATGTWYMFLTMEWLETAAF